MAVRNEFPNNVFPSYVLDWESFLQFDQPWVAELRERIEESGVRSLCTGTEDILFQDVGVFYDNVRNDDASDGLRADVQGVTVRVSRDVLKSVFHLPTAFVRGPSVGEAEMLEYFNYDRSSVAGRPDLQKNGFKDEGKFLVVLIGQCLLMKKSAFDSVSHEQLLYMYCVAQGIKLNWADVMFKQLETRKAQRGFGRLLSRIMRHQHPTVFTNRPAFPYPSKLILRKLGRTGGLEASRFAFKPPQPQPPKKKVVREGTSGSFREVTSCWRPSSSHHSERSHSKAYVRSVQKLVERLLSQKLAARGIGTPVGVETGEDRSEQQAEQPVEMPKDAAGGGHVVPIPSNFLTERLINDLWINYAQSHCSESEIYTMWLKTGQSLVNQEGLFIWGINTGYLTQPAVGEPTAVSESMTDIDVGAALEPHTDILNIADEGVQGVSSDILKEDERVVITTDIPDEPVDDIPAQAISAESCEGEHAVSGASSAPNVDHHVAETVRETETQGTYFSESLVSKMLEQMFLAQEEPSTSLHSAAKEDISIIDRRMETLDGTLQQLGEKLQVIKDDNGKVFTDMAMTVTGVINKMAKIDNTLEIVNLSSVNSFIKMGHKADVLKALLTRFKLLPHTRNSKLLELLEMQKFQSSFEELKTSTHPPQSAPPQPDPIQRESEPSPLDPPVKPKPQPVPTTTAKEPISKGKKRQAVISDSDSEDHVPLAPHQKKQKATGSPSAPHHSERSHSRASARSLQDADVLVEDSSLAHILSVMTTWLCLALMRCK